MNIWNRGYLKNPQVKSIVLVFGCCNPNILHILPLSVLKYRRCIHNKLKTVRLTEIRTVQNKIQDTILAQD